MLVIHLLHSNKYSGAENVVCQIIDMFNTSTDIQMIYCCPEGPIRYALEERNVKYVAIKELSVKEVKKVLKQYNPDIIHAHDMRASFIASLANNKAKLISHIHNNNFDSRGISVKAIAYMYAAFKAKNIIWVSDSSYAGYVFHKLFSRKSEVLYNIINITSLYDKVKLDKSEYDYDIVYLGRLTVQKNPIRLMNVLKRIIENNSEIKIAIIGAGDLDDETRIEAKKLNIENQVKFFGFCNNPYKILKDSKLMMMTSLWEGTPMCVLEAMSLGVPVVSTPTDGIKVVVEHQKTGLLSDNDEELAEYCLRIIGDNEYRKELSINSIDRANKLMNIELYRNRIKEIYTNK